MKTRKLTIMEKRAKAFCEYVKALNPGETESIVVNWNKSREWGYCPAIFDRNGEKMAYASGCGYCKESAALTDALTWLVEGGLNTHGAGVSAVQRALEQAGYVLKHTANGRAFDCYTIGKL